MDIPLNFYKTIIKHLPVLTVDLVIVHRGRVLLLKRAIQPFRGTWWIPGGRFQKGETFERAVWRIAKAETGLSVKIVKLLGVDGMHERRWGIDVHSIGVVYLVKPTGKSLKLKLNKESNDAVWFSHVPKKSHWFVRKFLREAGFR